MLIDADEYPEVTAQFRMVQMHDTAMLARCAALLPQNELLVNAANQSACQWCRSMVCLPMRSWTALWRP